MTRDRTTTAALLSLVLLPGAFLLLGAAEPAATDPEELIRQANAAYIRGAHAEADRLYAAAEERTADPGLVAFNLATVLFQKGEFRDAELHYARVIDDTACPPERAAKAWYNRGTCLVRRGGSAAVYRSAIACLERCLDSDAADDPLKADARYNLELAKTLWNNARKQENKPDKPNENPPPEDPRSDPPPPSGSNDEQPGTGDPGDGATGQQATRPIAQPTTTQTPNANDKNPQNPTGGASPAPALSNDKQLQQLTPEDTRDRLNRIRVRLKNAQHGLWDTLGGGDQSGVRDW